MIIFLFFSRKKGFDISCRLSHIGTVCMKCQGHFSGKNILKYLQNFLHSMLSIKKKKVFFTSKMFNYRQTTFEMSVFFLPENKA